MVTPPLYELYATRHDIWERWHELLGFLTLEKITDGEITIGDLLRLAATAALAKCRFRICQLCLAFAAWQPTDTLSLLTVAIAARYTAPMVAIQSGRCLNRPKILHCWE